MSTAKGKTERGAADFLPVTVVVCLGLALAIIAFFIVQAYFLREERLRFQHDVAYYSTNFQNDVDRHVSSLAAIQAFVSASHKVSRWEFSAFAHQILPEHSGFRAILWAPRIAQSDRAKFESALQHDGLYGLRIRELRSNGRLADAIKRPEYLPVEYIEPFEGNESLVGVDLLDNHIYAPIFNAAQKSGRVVASAPLSQTLIPGSVAPSVMLAFPLTPKLDLRQHSPGGARMFNGFALGVMQLGNVLAHTFNARVPLQAAIAFGPPGALTVFDAKHAGRRISLDKWLGSSKLHKAIPFTVAEQHYLLVLQSASPASTLVRAYVSTGAALLVIAITSLLAQTLLVAVIGKRTVEQAVVERTMQLRQANAAMAEEITQRRQVERDLKTAKELAESASRSKSAFLSTMSHELRTPLNAIIGFSGILSDGHVLADSRASDYVMEINSSGRHLLELINDILEVTQMDSEDIRSGDLVFLPELIEATILAMEPSANASRVLLRDMTSDALPFLRGDTKRLQRALHHLVSNSVKFTETGGTVSISASHDTTGLKLEVSDEGVGMPPDALARISSAFSQFDSSLARKHEGVGLGLTYVRKVAEHHGAIFDIASRPGLGTRVSLRFPHHRIVRQSEVA
jgi:signal transduction histidine kinase